MDFVTASLRRPNLARATSRMCLGKSDLAPDMAARKIWTPEE
jgi:hypothetical protein